MNRQAVYVTVGELAARGKKDIPAKLLPRKNLIYSSPATLAFNSPGAEGFGVKRAGLSVPGSVMLVVSPGCCARNTSAITAMPGYENRFFYLTMDQTDLVTGRHLTKIPEAVKSVCESLEMAPSVVMVCSTCVDALLGSDMERVCRKAETLTGVKVRPCYMYALTREGSRPPMVQVRQSIYSLLEPLRRRSGDINLLGYFSPLDEESEVPALLKSAGVRTVRQIGACSSYEEFMQMAQANVNLVLDGEAREAAADMERQLGIPYVELRRLYQIERIASQYRALGQALGIKLDDAVPRRSAQDAVSALQSAYPGLTISVGEWANADPFELALALTGYGFRVAEIFAAPNADSYRYLDKLSSINPDIRVYMNQSPSMMLYEPITGVDVTIGRDAGYYHPECPNVPWASDRQPWGYGAVRGLATRMLAVLSGQEIGADEGIRLSAGGSVLQHELKVVKTAGGMASASAVCTARPAGLHLQLTPFAPDQSGAEEVLFSLGGMSIVLDAGGCTGNLCGFDEPRWFSEKSRVMSAGMRDIDAVLGRDKALLKPAGEASQLLEPAFTALIGTPVPAVIAMDYRAMEKYTQDLTGKPCIGIDTDGMHAYDIGMQKAYQALLEKFAVDVSDEDICSGRIGVWGCVPLDIGAQSEADALRRLLQDAGWAQVCLYGYDANLEELRSAGCAVKNLVISPGGLAAARYLKERFGTPYEIADPLAERLYADVLRNACAGQSVLIVHQQVRAQTLGREALRAGAAHVTQASWFKTDAEISECRRLKQESDFARLVYESGCRVVIADPVMRKLLPAFDGCFIPVPHFAVSGILEEG